MLCSFLYMLRTNEISPGSAIRDTLASGMLKRLNRNKNIGLHLRRLFNFTIQRTCSRSMSSM
jgi:hypothetical protein